MRVTLKLDGAEEMKRNLEQLGRVSSRRITMAAMERALGPVVMAARAKVPKKTGRLFRSIGVGPKLTKRQSRLKRPIAPAEVYVGPGTGAGGYRAVAHAHLVEFGTHKMAPRPYMRPAWQASIRRVFNLLGAEMRERILRALKRRAKRAA